MLFLLFQLAFDIFKLNSVKWAIVAIEMNCLYYFILIDCNKMIIIRLIITLLSLFLACLCNSSVMLGSD